MTIIGDHIEIGRLNRELSAAQRDLETANLRIAELEAELNNAHDVHRDSSEIIAAQHAQLTEAERLLRKCRDEMGCLPHSLGYDFTHLPELNKFLSSSPPSDGDKGGGA